MNIKHLTKIINGKKILDDITLTINKGEIIGLVGRNGAGKTTFFRCLASHYTLTTGKIFIDNEEIQQNDQLKQKIFYIDEQYNFFSSYTLKNIVHFYKQAYPTFDFEKYIHLTHVNQLLPQSKYLSLSKGMKALYKFILAICSNAEYIFLDEPFDGLDILIKKNILDLLLDDLSQQNRAIILSSHNLNELETIIDRAFFIKNNQIQFNYHLETFREHARKIRLVFKNNQLPSIVVENSQLICSHGRTKIVIFENYTKEIDNLIQQEGPLLFEELPVTLEDIFEIHLSQREIMTHFEVNPYE